MDRSAGLIGHFFIRIKGDMNSKIHRFYATSIGGLEDVVLDDCQNRLIGLEKVRIERGGRVGRIFFQYERSPKQLVEIHSAVGVFALLAEVFGITVGKTSIERIKTKITALNIEPVQRLARACGAATDGSHYDLNVTLQGHHRFTTLELRRAVQEVLEGQHGLRGGEDGLSFYLQVTGKRAIFGLRLSSRSMETALACSLTYLMGMQPQDRVVGLHCRGGESKVMEEAGFAQCFIALSEMRIKEPEANNISVVGEVNHMPIIDAGMTYVMAYSRLGRTNLSWGELAEVARVIEPGGVVGLVVQAPRQWVAGLQEANLPFDIMAGVPINLKGRRCGLLLLERIEEFDAQIDLLDIEWDDV
jgi:hypothetical protein